MAPGLQVLFKDDLALPIRYLGMVIILYYLVFAMRFCSSEVILYGLYALFCLMTSEVTYNFENKVFIAIPNMLLANNLLLLLFL